jgi:hypothetical protein
MFSAGAVGLKRMQQQQQQQKQQQSLSLGNRLAGSDNRVSR